MSALRIGVLLPEVLGTYADGGNALVLAERARRRGIDARIEYVGVGDAIPDDLDIYTLGGGEDAAHELAVETFTADSGLKRAVEAGRPLLQSVLPCRSLATGTRMRVIARFLAWDSWTLRPCRRVSAPLVNSLFNPKLRG